MHSLNFQVTGVLLQTQGRQDLKECQGAPASHLELSRVLGHLACLSAALLQPGSGPRESIPVCSKHTPWATSNVHGPKSNVRVS